ncbi:MAG TPA: type II toxin-antitoxin system RelE/ParE family toxin [Candidatus Dormibacteraeota bacterium]|nr:type II toxin-antitoxin system RelE/ParE family toxin [Candidatus Dormibacteraeota bacterium]
MYRVQSGRDPSDWKPLAPTGPGCREIRVRDSRDAYRVFYVAAVSDAVYVLHCFEEKSRQTAKTDIGLGKQRDKQMREITQARGTP